MVNSDLELNYRIWRQGETADSPATGFPAWPDSGVALIGDLSGIQCFVFRPVPGAGGAARRLRSRSFRVSAYTELIAQWCLDQLQPGEAHLVYAAGGRFLIGTQASEGWREKVAAMQRQVDEWAWREFKGELVFHLAAVDYSSGKIPGDPLRSALEARRRRPLQHSLQPGGKWSADFFQGVSGSEARCDACSMTKPLRPTGDGEDICEDCRKDEEVGRKLATSNFVCISRQAEWDVSALGLGMSLHKAKDTGFPGDRWLSLGQAGTAEVWPLLHHLPSESGRALDFKELADRSPGSRKWLGYLRIDVDRAGACFDELQGDPVRTWALSRLLNTFFAVRANDLIRANYQSVYAVYGGGDDLFVVGPWTDLLDLALALRQELALLTLEALTFSAGLSLAKPHEHVLTQATLSGEELERAKQGTSFGRDCGRDQIRALGATVHWQTFKGLLATAKRVKQWVEDRVLPSSFLHQALQLHRDWSGARNEHPHRNDARVCRYRPLLYYQAQRNLKPGEAKDWVLSLLKPKSEWPWADFVMRYAMLAAEKPESREG